MNVTRAILALVMTLLLGLAGPQAWANNGVAAGHLKVTAVDGSYVNTNVTVTPTVLINGFLPVQLDTWTITTPTSTNTFLCWNTADYYVQIGETRADDVAKGILIGAVAQNVRTNQNASNTNAVGYAAPSVTEESFGSWRIQTQTTNV
ncbi:MAG TPA: hypothetical protein PLG12_03285, partial [Verrucomicrobiota bacterium]|nr:hypothetical protein [Verrucomicrobiota bacterium]